MCQPISTTPNPSNTQITINANNHRNPPTPEFGGRQPTNLQTKIPEPENYQKVATQISTNHKLTTKPMPQPITNQSFYTINHKQLAKQHSNNKSQPQNNQTQTRRRKSIPTRNPKFLKSEEPWGNKNSQKITTTQKQQVAISNQTRVTPTTTTINPKLPNEYPKTRNFLYYINPTGNV